MTGQGRACIEDETLGRVTVEIRSVNHRGLKTVFRTPDSLSWIEPELLQSVRQHVGRGSVHVNIAWIPADGLQSGAIDTAAVDAIASRLIEIRRRLLDQGMSADEIAPIQLSEILIVPDVCQASDNVTFDRPGMQRIIIDTTQQALASLNTMRGREAIAMVRQMKQDLSGIRDQTAQIAQAAPQVLETYRERLQTKIESMLRKQSLDASQVDIIREVQIYADRCDISEELTRLASHLEMFETVLDGEPGSGRKLDFVIQEMFRETNTIGSKCQHAGIAAAVVEIKSAVERMRELVQNLE